ncbi:hypothetical protein KJ068_17315 [bacterium]|nr:hypothetical protein [bacterium]
MRVLRMALFVLEIFFEVTVLTVWGTAQNIAAFEQMSSNPQTQSEAL